MPLQTALVVDDSKLARITLQRLLQKHNLKVNVAESGVVALEQLKTSKPDIIFMDHLMPELDGFEATQKIKADPSTKHIPVIMCTGKEGVDNYDEQARGIGASGTLAKPPQADALATILAAANAGAEPPAMKVAAAKVAKPAATPKISTTTAATELDLILERIEKLEKSRDSINFSQYQERLHTAENSLSTIQETLIALRNQEQPKVPSSDEIVSQVNQQLSGELEKHIQSVNAELKGLDAWKSGLQQQTEQSISEKLAAQAINTASQEAAVIDEEALAARIVQDAEQILKPVLLEDISSLEQRIASSTDEAISESRKDLDEQLSQAVSKIESNLPQQSIPAAGEILNLVKGDIEKLASQSAKIIVEENLSTLPNLINSRISEATKDLANQQKQQSKPEPAVVDTNSILESPKLASIVYNTVEEQLRTQISKQGEELVQQITNELTKKTEEKEKRLQSVIHRFDELEKRQDAVNNHLNELKDSQVEESPTNASGGSGGLILGGLALVSALAALAKAFALF